MDVTLALMLLAVMVAAASELEPSLQVTVGIVLGTVQVVAVLFRRSRPLVVLAVVVAIDLGGCLWLRELPFDAVSLATLVALYAVGRYRPYVTGWWSGFVACVAILGVQALLDGMKDLPNLLAAFLTLVLGQYIRLRAETAARERADQAAEAVHAERRRIARELHDVVAHHISVMNVLVGAARTTMATDPAQANEALVTTEHTAREAMVEMRQLLAVLRADDADIEPEPGARAERVGELVERARAAGVDAALEMVGAPRPLPSTTDLAIYRTVQEALTNAHKHAPGARVRVVLRYTATAVEAEVRDDGPGVAGRPARGHGYGLRGMAERLALCGGELTAGPGPGGGFRVRALIPLPQEAT